MKPKRKLFYVILMAGSVMLLGFAIYQSVFYRQYITAIYYLLFAWYLDWKAQRFK